MPISSFRMICSISEMPVSGPLCGPEGNDLVRTANPAIAITMFPEVAFCVMNTLWQTVLGSSFR